MNSETLKDKIIDIVKILDNDPLSIISNQISECIDTFDKYIELSEDIKDDEWIYIKYAAFLEQIDYIDTKKIQNLYLKNINTSNSINMIKSSYYGLLKLCANRFAITDYFEILNKYTSVFAKDDTICTIEEDFYKSIIDAIEKRYISDIATKELLRFYSNNINNSKEQDIYEVLLSKIINNVGSQKLINKISEKKRYKFIDFEQSDEHYNIIYCTNDRYAKPMLVSLLSFVINHRHLLSCFKFFIFLDETITKDTRKNIEKFCHQFKIDITLIEIASLNMPMAFKTKYGASQSSTRDLGTLDKSAYYRIFAINHIAQYFNQNQILYLDSDTIILSSLLCLFQKHKDQPLYAHEEPYSAYVNESKGYNNLNFYFNSGVLLLNPKHTDFYKCIQTSIKMINEYDRLFFQDQCALNIGFDNSWNRLTNTYNFLLHTYKLSLTDSPAILHYSGPQKVWMINSVIQELPNKIWYGYHNTLLLLLDNQ